MEQRQVHYADGDMVILENLLDFQQVETTGAGMILSIIVAEGQLRLDIGGGSMEVRARDILICPPKTVMENIFSTPDFRGLIFGMSYSKFQKIVGPDESVWSVMMYAREHPVYHMTDAELRIGNHIFQLFREKLSGPRDYYYKEVMQSLMVTAFYEISIIIKRNMVPVGDGHVRQNDVIFKRFLTMLAESDGRRRSVADYARVLCISPKYLSACVRSVSGRSALSWIHEYTVEGVARQLRNSDRSVKEIAADYGFTSLSAFGKFVKLHLGKSPRAFREENGKSVES
ncbi:MAG: helix-turn-helix domain-containing protein [Bacteroidales bacterium]|nr:helix-turn-helix domain-containing protein [Bacteroidales bacterium]